MVQIEEIHMKTRKMFTLVFAVVICTMTSCFRPDGSAAGDADKTLVGYWELVHVVEESQVYDIYEDGTLGEVQVYSDSYDVACNDGNNQWSIMRITGSAMSIVATDDPDVVAIIGLPIPYAFDGKKLVSSFIELDYGGNVAEVEFVNDDCMEFYILDEGDIYDEETGRREAHEKYQSWTTFRRVKDEN